RDTCSAYHICYQFHRNCRSVNTKSAQERSSATFDIFNSSPPLAVLFWEQCWRIWTSRRGEKSVSRNSTERAPIISRILVFLIGIPRLLSQSDFCRLKYFNPSNRKTRFLRDGDALSSLRSSVRNRRRLQRPTIE
uniref:Uncharacterized protein n=1 Tax=Parascaris univalens TaxID=6257 RepID=A0A915A3X4_PARUN